MKVRPILMSAPMVRALLAGTKTQTRRVVKPQPWASCVIEEGMDGETHFVYSALSGHGPGYDVEETRTPCRCPYGQPGDQLWVRETWGYIDPDCSGDDHATSADDAGPGLHSAPELMQEGHPLRNFWLRRTAYRASWNEPRYGNGPDAPKCWRPSIHMPRWASRITLEVTGVRVERLQDISEADALSEGIVPAGDGNGFQLADTTHYSGNPIDSYFSLWEHINGAGSVDANPWVWCVGFKRVEAA